MVKREQDGKSLNLSDIVAARVIVNLRGQTSEDIDVLRAEETPSVRAIAGALEGKFPINVAEKDDYVSHPKDNGYMSIQFPIEIDGGIVEVQIRGHWMHRHNEYGSAGHHFYKGVTDSQEAARNRTTVSCGNQLIELPVNACVADVIATKIGVSGEGGCDPRYLFSLNTAIVKRIEKGRQYLVVLKATDRIKPADQIIHYDFSPALAYDSEHCTAITESCVVPAVKQRLQALTQG